MKPIQQHLKKAPVTRRKLSFIALAAAVVAFSTFALPGNYFTAVSENPLIRALKSRLFSWESAVPSERLYLQTDKTFCIPGEDIWFSAYLREGATLRPAGSQVIHVELINPQGAVEKKISLVAFSGKAAGDFHMEREAAGGIYKLRAYTNWMRNFSEDCFFEKDITVQDLILPRLKMGLEFEKKGFGPGDEVIARLDIRDNEDRPLSLKKISFVATIAGNTLIRQAENTGNDGIKYLRFRLPPDLKSVDGLLNVMIEHEGITESISRSIPIALNKITLEIFPEGGELVRGLESAVAFRASNEWGKGTDVEGVIETSAGSRVATFSSLHLGMGAFRITPQEGERYFARITRPEGITEKFSLPSSLERGYVLNIDNSTPGEVEVNILTTETEELSLLVTVRGRVYYSTVVNAIGPASKVTFSTKDFPPGVAQVTLFDAKGIARAERMVFVNRDKQLNIGIEMDKDKYLPREKIRMTLSAKDERGMPIPARLSVAVVNDQLLSFAADKSGDILPGLLLAGEVSGKVEEPSFYFKKEEKAARALDYLLLTAGWRQFTWEDIMDENFPEIGFPCQKAVIAGTVLDAATSEPVEAVLTVPGELKLTAADGKFTFKRIDLSEPVTVTVSAPGYQAQTIQLNDYDGAMAIYLHRPGRGFGMNRGNFPQMAMAGRVAEDQLMPEASPVGSFQAAMKIKAGAALKANIHGHKIAHLDAKPRVFKKQDDAMDEPAPGEIPQTLYYRARRFAPVIHSEGEPAVRTDFRNTIYWNPDIEIGASGKKTIEFFASDDVTSFRAIAEGIGRDGLPGHGEKVFMTTLPFSVSAVVPSQVCTGDRFLIPVILRNNTNGPLGGVMSVNFPAGLAAAGSCTSVQTIMPGSSKTVYLDVNAVETGEGNISVAFRSCGMDDSFLKNISIRAKGFPVQRSFSSQEPEKEFEFETDHMVNGSLKATFTAFPNVVTDLLKGVEGILQEPYGCFEQTSCTAYPNAMVLDYLKHTGSNDTRLLARANDLLDRGYKRLITFETPGRGYEWFGANPAHEGLTAYGIMEFADMKRAGQAVDEKMMERTVQWLMSHRDGRGGFERQQRALHDFGRISDDILNAYIVYAMAEAGYKGFKNEFGASYNKALASGDPYLLAMMTNAAFAMNEAEKGSGALNALLSKQDPDGSFRGTQHSITYSQGSSLVIETTALSIMAMLSAPQKPAQALGKAVQFLVSSRSGSGVFSSTQGTVLALKALTAYAKYSKQTSESGRILIFVDNRKVLEKAYERGEKDAISFDLGAYLTGNGKHRIKIKYADAKTPLPYAIAVNWNTTLPESSKECVIGVRTRMSSATAKKGETVRLTATISNRADHDVPSTVAVIGIPGGLSVQPWQLKELMEKNTYDFYEVKNGCVVFYFRGMAPVSEREVNLELKADVAGTFEAPASCGYLYYTNEYKTWTSTGKVTVEK